MLYAFRGWSKAAGSLVPSQARPAVWFRAPCSIQVMTWLMISLGDLLSLHGPGRRLGQTRRRCAQKAKQGWQFARD